MERQSEAWQSDAKPRAPSSYFILWPLWHSSAVGADKERRSQCEEKGIRFVKLTAVKTKGALFNVELRLMQNLLDPKFPSLLETKPWSVFPSGNMPSIPVPLDVHPDTSASSDSGPHMQPAETTRGLRGSGQTHPPVVMVTKVFLGSLREFLGFLSSNLHFPGSTPFWAFPFWSRSRVVNIEQRCQLPLLRVTFMEDLASPGLMEISLLQGLHGFDHKVLSLQTASLSMYSGSLQWGAGTV